MVKRLCYHPLIFYPHTQTSYSSMVLCSVIQVIDDVVLLGQVVNLLRLW